jgi:hypothetical protein
MSSFTYLHEDYLPTIFDWSWPREVMHNCTDKAIMTEAVFNKLSLRIQVYYLIVTHQVDVHMLMEFKF